MQNLSQKIKQITNRKRLAVVTFFTVIVLAGFGFAGQASATYEATGNWTSTNLLLGETVTSIDSFVYNLSAKPANTDATIQFSQNNTNWYNSAGVLDGTDTLTTGVNNTINLSVLGWSDANFYYKTTFTSSDGVGTPVLDDISVTFTGDITNPTVSTLSPVDGATGVATSSNLVITFSEAVDVETGNITIKKTDNTVIETIPVGDARVTGTGSTTITINPTGTLTDQTEYYVLIDATAFDDPSGNLYAGISSTTAWSFTTVDETPPTGLTALSTTGHTTSSISLSWSQVSETNFDHYEVWYGAVQADVENRSGSATEWDNTDDGALATITTTSTTITGLNPNTANYYKIWAVDDYGNMETVDPVLIYNSANAPLAPTVTATATGALNVIVAINANPSSTEFAIQVTTTELTQYVQANGTFGVAEVWQTYAQWGGALGQAITGLTSNTQYGISVKARNGDSDETAFSTGVSKYTWANPVTVVGLSDTTTDSTYGMSLTWTNGTQNGIKIDFSSVGGGSCDETYDIGNYDNTISSSSSPRSISASANTCYKARIGSYNNDGILNTTDYAYSPELTTPPAQPTGLTNDTADEATIDWTWTEVTGATNYRIYRASDDIFIGETGDATEVYEQTTIADGAEALVANTQYTVYVRAENANGEGIASSDASAYTDANAPANLAQDPDFRTTDTLRWVWESGGFEESFYAWMVAPVVDSGFVDVLLWDVGGEGVLSANTPYTAYVKARNGGDPETTTETTSVSAQAYTAQAEPSSISFVVVGVNNVHSIELSAVGDFANLTEGLSGVRFINTTTAADNTFQTTSWINTSLNPNTEYSYTVSALNGDGVETVSVTDVKYTLANVPGASVIDDAAVYTLDVAINVNANPSNTEFAIFETTTGQYVQIDGTLGDDVAWLVVGTDAGEWGENTTTEGKVRVSGLAPNTNYEFQVKAKNGEDVETEFGVVQSLYTLVEEPSSPELSNPTTGSLDLLIAQGANPETTQYKIFESVLEKYVQADGTLADDPVYQTAVVWGAVAAVDGQITINGLDNNTEYTFVVIARNVDGVESSASDSASLYTLAVEPTSLTGTIDEDSGAALTWVGGNPEMTEYFASRVDDESINSGWITTLSWTDALATDPGTEYCYLVKAWNGNEIETSTTSPTCLTIPVVVTTGGGGSVRVVIEEVPSDSESDVTPGIEEEDAAEEPVSVPELQIALEKEKLVEATKATTVVVTKVVTDKRRVNLELVFAPVDNPRVSAGGIPVEERVLPRGITEEQKEVANLFTGNKLDDSEIKDLEKAAESLITSKMEKSFENVSEIEIFNGGRKKLINKETKIIFTADQRKVVDIQKYSGEDVIVVGPSTMGPGKVSLLLASIYDGDFSDPLASKKIYFNGLRAWTAKDVPEPPLIPKVTNMHGNEVGTNALFWVAGQPQQKVYLYAVKKSLMDRPETWKTVDLGNYLIDENGQAIVEVDFEKYFKEVIEGLEIIVQTERGVGSKIVVDYDPLMDFALEYVYLSDGKIVAKPPDTRERKFSNDSLRTSVLSASSKMMSKSLKREEEGISDPKFLSGYTQPGTVIFVTWKSFTYNSVVVADASQGYFEVRIPEELEQGDHAVIAYSVNLDTGQSSTFAKLFFSKLL